MSLPFRAIAASVPSAMGALTTHYLTQTLTETDRALAFYYEREGLGQLRPDMSSRVALGLGVTIGGNLTKGQIDALLAGRRADGEVIDGKHYAARRRLPADSKTGEARHTKSIGAVDFVASPSKSIQVAHAFGTPSERATIYRCHIEAARLAVGQVVGERGTIRLGAGGLSGTMPAEVGWIEFTHRTERKVLGQDHEADPGLHTHFVTFSATFGEGGKVGSLDTGHLEAATFPADALYHAALAANLRAAGFDPCLDIETGAARMAIIPDAVCKLFSKRSGHGEAAARAWTEDRGEVWTDLSPVQRTARIKAAAQSRDQKAGVQGDGVQDIEGWKRQALERCGWTPPASLKHAIALPALSPDQRHRVAYEVAISYLADQFARRSVLPEWHLRVAAGRGLVAAGYDRPDDIEAVVRLMRAEGVRQDGQHTRLIVATEPGERSSGSISTEKHAADEGELVRLVAAASKDRSGSLPPDTLIRTIESSCLTFDGEHGRAQRAAIDRLGTGGRFGMLIAASGAGKTSLLRALVPAWEAEGREVNGTSLGSRQSDALAEAGIRPDRLIAVIPLLAGIESGAIKLNRDSVLVVDEVGQLGTRSGLRLMQAQARLGFSVVAIGDDKQIGAVEAGNFIALAQQATGEVPRIDTTRRQRSQREREIAGLIRAGDAAAALDMKCADGTAMMLPGSRADVIDGIAQLYRDRLIETGTAPTISAPTNQDAHDIAKAVRMVRRGMGLIAADAVKLRATDGPRDYELPLAAGDHVRLFRSTRAAGVGRGGSIGRNQSVLEVVEVRADGLVFRTEKGRTALVHWDALRDKTTGRILLSYGSCLTGHAAQGVTSAEHITALPSGSGGIGGGALYSAGTRHTDRGYLVTSEAAETRAVRQSRPIGDPDVITEADRWAMVARAMARQTPKDTALDMMRRARLTMRGSVIGFQSAEVPLPREPVSPVEPPPAMLHRWTERAVELAYRVTRQAIEAVQERRAQYQGLNR